MLARLSTGSLLPARGVGSRVSNSHLRHGGRPCFQLRCRRSRRCVVRSLEPGRSGPSTDAEDQAGPAPPPAEQRAAEGQPEEPQAAEGQAEEQTSLQLPADVVQRLRTTVFGFTFFVTSAENYQADGVLFKGNLREEPALAYTKMAARLKVRACFLKRGSANGQQCVGPGHLPASPQGSYKPRGLALCCAASAGPSAVPPTTIAAG